MIAAQAVERPVSQRVTSENERGVTEVTHRTTAHRPASLRSQSPHVPRELEIDRLLAENELSIPLLTPHDGPFSFLTEKPRVERAAARPDEGT